jgi:hypothetical protein
VIHFLWAEGVPGGQIYQHMCAKYGDNVLSHTVVYEWTDAERLGRSTTATTAQNEERARESILQDRRVTVDENNKTTQLNISTESAYSVCMITFSSTKCLPSGYLRN